MTTQNVEEEKRVHELKEELRRIHDSGRFEFERLMEIRDELAKLRPNCWYKEKYGSIR